MNEIRVPFSFPISSNHRNTLSANQSALQLLVLSQKSLTQYPSRRNEAYETHKIMYNYYFPRV